MAIGITKTPGGKKAFWVVGAFYLIIGFEFFYMASPFAAYFYSVYGPGLRYFSENPVLAWLSRLFLPHIVAESQSFLLDLRNSIGGILAFMGFLGFCLGAGQVYYRKLAKKSAATGGLYTIVRHPQYACLILCGFGLLLLWPRYIVLLSFTVMIFVYYFLAKHEEGECESKFGEPYREYKARTPMFLPLPRSLWPEWTFVRAGGMLRYPTILLVFGIVSVTAVFAANGLKVWSVKKLYGLYTHNEAFVSIAKAETEALKHIVGITLENPDVRKRIEAGRQKVNDKFIHYILPAQWYVSELPMNQIEGAVGGHHHPKGYDRTLQRIVFTRAELGTDREAVGRDILLQAVRNEPLFEVVVDLAQNQVVGIKDPPNKRKYAGIPLPLY